MIDIYDINSKSFDVIQFNVQLTFHYPYYIASYNNDISFVSPNY